MCCRMPYRSKVIPLLEEKSVARLKKEDLTSFDLSGVKPGSREISDDEVRWKQLLRLQHASTGKQSLRTIRSGVGFDPKLLASLEEITKQPEHVLIKKWNDVMVEQEARNKSFSWCDNSLAAAKGSASISNQQCTAVCNVLAEFSNQPSPTPYQPKFLECRSGNAFHVNRLWPLIVIGVLTSTLTS